MVSISDVNNANAALKSAPSPTAVVVGGTHGIGEAFVRQLATHTASPRIYIVGRSQSLLANLITALNSLNTSGTYIPIATPDLTLVANAHAAALDIVAQEKASPSPKIDILYLSPGYLTFRRRDASEEDLDRITALRYHSRMRIVLDLLPLLSKSPSPRVLTVLGAGQEGEIFPSDLALKEPEHSSAMTAVGAAMAYTTLFLEQLARRHPNIAFIHSFPGIVKTNVFNHPEHLGPVIRFLANWVLFPLLGWLMAVPVEEAGARCLYMLTSPEFAPAEGGDAAVAVVGSDGKKGSGAYAVNEKCEAVVNNKVLQRYREDGLDEKVWEYTMAEYERILGQT